MYLFHTPIGFLIYFTYGIRNSSEAALNRPGTSASTIQDEHTVTEKSTFLCDRQTAALDDDEDS